MSTDDFDWLNGYRPQGSAKALSVKRVSNYTVTVWRGWRMDSIDRMLDTLAQIEGGVFADVPAKLVNDGQRYSGDRYRFYWRQSARRNKEKANANSRRQAEVWRARARLEWEAYCRQYKIRFGDTGTDPIGFGTWSKTKLKAWKADPESVLHINRRDSKAVAKEFRLNFEKKPRA